MMPCCLVLLSVALLQPTISGFEDSIQYEPDALFEELDELGDEDNPWNETLYEETEEEEEEEERPTVPGKDEARSTSLSFLPQRTQEGRQPGPADRLRWPYPRHPLPDDVYKTSVLRPVTKLFRPRYEEYGRKHARDLKLKRLRSRLRVKPRNKLRGSRKRGVAWREGPKTWDQPSLDDDGFWSRVIRDNSYK